MAACCVIALRLIALVTIVSAAWLTGAEERSVPTGQRLAQLEKRLSFIWESMTVSDALRDWADKAKLKIELVNETRRAKHTRGDAFRHKVHMVLLDVRAKDVLEMLCSMARLRVEMHDEVMRILKPEEVGNYPLDELIVSSPKVLAGGAGMGYLAGESSFDPFADDSDGQLNAYDIEDLIKTHVEPGSWDPDLDTSIEEQDGRLVVIHAPRVHAQIRRLLAELGGRVELDVRLTLIRSSDVEVLAQGARSRGSPVGLLDRSAMNQLDELLRQNTAQRIYAGSATSVSGQSVVLRQTRPQRYVRSYEAGDNQLDPVPADIHLGTSVWLCPWLSADGRNLRVALRAGWQELAGEPQVFDVLRGGSSVVREGIRKITFRQKPSTPKAKDHQGLRDVTDEFEISTKAEPPTKAVTEDLQVVLPTLARADLRLDLDLPADAYGFATMPATNTEGPIPGHEFLVVVCGHPLNAGLPVAGELVPVPPAPEQHVVSPAYSAEISGKLTREVELNFDGARLDKALGDLSEKTGVSIAIDYGKAEGAGQRTVTWAGGLAPGIKVLDEILRQAECEVQVFDTVLLVSARSVPPPVEPTERSPYQTRFYDVRDMTSTFDDTCNWAAPSSDIDLDEGGVQFVRPTQMPSLCTVDLVVLLKERLMPDRFADARSGIEEMGGRLVIKQTPENHEQVRRHLDELRRKAMTPVHLTARWLTVEEEDLGRDVPALLDGPQTARVLDILSRPGTRALSATRVTTYSGQRIYSFGSRMVHQVEGYTADGAFITPCLSVALEGTGYAWRVAAQNKTRLPDIAEDICVEGKAYLSVLGSSAPLQDPLALQKGTPRSASSSRALMPGPIQSNSDSRVKVDTVLRIPDGGAALMRYSVPDWLRGEPEDPAKRARRVLMLLVQAERRK